MSAQSDAAVEAGVLKMVSASGVQGVPSEVLKENFGKAQQSFQNAMSSLLYATGPKKIAPFTRQGVMCYRMAALAGTAKGKMGKSTPLSDMERTMVDAIKGTENKGLWIRDMVSSLKHQGYTPTMLSKATKRLEKEQIIKTVVTNKKQKVLMMFNMEPHESLIGGTWFTEETKEFDREFVQAVYKSVFQFVKDHDTVTIACIERAISSSEVAKKPLSTDDILSIIQILIFDGKLIEVDANNGSKYYQFATQLVDWHPFTETPCMSCPIQSQCDSSGSDPFNPQTCPYMGQWLS